MKQDRLGNGDGTFKTRVSLAASVNVFSVRALDLNNDGNIDLAFAQTGGNSLGVRLGNGDGTFGKEMSYIAGVSPSFITTGDINDDGTAD